MSRWFGFGCWFLVSCAKREPAPLDACPDVPEAGGRVAAVYQGGNPLFQRSKSLEAALDVAAFGDGAVAVGYETEGVGPGQVGWIAWFDADGELTREAVFSDGDRSARATHVAVSGDAVWVGGQVGRFKPTDHLAWLGRWEGDAAAWSWRASTRSDVSALAVTGDGVAVGGRFFGPSFDVAGVEVTSAADQSAYLALFAGDQVRWARALGGEGSQYVTVDGIAALDGGLVAVGRFSARAEIGEITLTSDYRNASGWAARWDRDGNVLWAKKLAEPAVNPGSVAVLADGTLVVGGAMTEIAGEVVIGPGDPGEMRHTAQGHDGFVLWLDADGRVLATHVIASAADEGVSDIAALGCDVVVAGQIWTWKPGAGAAPPGEAFVARLARGGREVWRCGALGDSAASRSSPIQHAAYAVSVGPEAVWAAGVLHGTAAFGCGEPVLTRSTDSLDSEDWWVGRFGR